MATAMKEVAERFESFIFDWYYEEYLLIGGYGSGKSYDIALKIILKLIAERRKVLVVREVFETIRESCFDLFIEILNEMNLLDPDGRVGSTKKVTYRTSPLQIIFPNGSRIIFKGMDKPVKLKSINGVSIVWIEEAAEVKYDGYKELKGRIRHPKDSIHFILSTNPVDKNTWVYQHFFVSTDEQGQEHVILDDEVLYKLKTCVVKNRYYHHSTCDDNPFLPASYRRQLDEMAEYDPDLYRIARLGRFGVNGLQVLPQFEIAKSHKYVIDKVRAIPKEFRFRGFDFGFELSYNALLKMAVDKDTMTLYIYWEYYKNKMTDDETADELIELGLANKDPKTGKAPEIIADSEDPKAIKYYKKRGFNIRKCHKFAGSRLSNIRKIKRFKHIVCSPNCINTIRELSNLTYKKENNGNLKYDEFNYDPHTFSAIWYGLDKFIIPDIKQSRNSKAGGR